MQSTVVCENCSISIIRDFGQLTRWKFVVGGGNELIELCQEKHEFVVTNIIGLLVVSMYTVQ
jgi:hypothetical protein